LMNFYTSYSVNPASCSPARLPHCNENKGSTLFQ
jgi:hypothetical protein